jgi:eukaryotic-like serine/threonine-protein kinase
MTNQRYRLLESLGAGGMGTVFRALDRLNGQHVALKQVLTDLPVANDDGFDLRMALAHEFRLMASLHHPNVIDVLDYGFDAAQQPFYTMDLIEEARTIVEAGRGQPLASKISLVGQLLQALAYLHRRQIVHRDLKPSNVLASGTRIKVLDFGLSMVMGQMPENVSSTAGTMSYIAPEVLTTGRSSIQSDLYAAGVIAYELFVGRHPYDTSTMTNLLKEILHGTPDFSPVADQPEIAVFLMKLLAKQPDDRYSSADDALRALHAAAPDSLANETIEIRESYLKTAPFIGRSSEFSLLVSALGEAFNGHGSTWLIGGESGVGKSRLVEELAVQAMVQGALVLRGQSVPQGATPYQLWQGVLRRLSLLTELSEDDAMALRTVLPDASELLERQLNEETASTSGNMQRQVARLLEEMLRHQQQPVVIILEDLQWAKTDTLAILQKLNRLTNELKLLILGSYRDDERPELASMLPEMRPIKLSRLSEENLAHLSEAILGQSGRDPQVLDLLQRETEGNVFFLIEVIRALADDAGQLDQIGIVTLPRQVFAGGVQKIVERRLNAIPPGDIPLLQLAAVAGRQIDLALLNYVAPSVDLERWLMTCANAAVLEKQDGLPTEQTWRFAHDRLRDGLMSHLSDDVCHALHEKIALALEAIYPNVPEKAAALAYHWGYGGNRAKERLYAIRAGDQHLRIGLYKEALEFLARALELSSAEDEMIAVKRLMAEACLGLGLYDDAERMYEDVLRFNQRVGETLTAAAAQQRLGDIAYALEDYGLAQSRYEFALNTYRTLNEVTRTANILNCLGNVAYELEDYHKATELYQSSLALSRASGVQWGSAGSIGHTGEGED